MKVLQIIDSLDPGGAERVCVDLTNLLHQNGIHVSVLTIIGMGELAALLQLGIQVNCLNRKHKFQLSAMVKLAKILKEYDVIHVHMRYTYRYVRLVALLFFINKKIILHDHYGSIDIDQTVPLLLTGFLTPQYYIGVSKTLTNWAETKLKINPDKIFLLENVVARVELPLVTAQDTAVLVANFNRVKNHIFAIQIIEKTQFNLVIYGKVFDTVYFEEVKEYIRQHGLGERVRFVHDEINVQRQLGKYKFGLHTARSESGPLVLIEYLAQSMPFLAYETGQVAREIKGELPDFFIDNINLDEWQARIEQILKTDRRHLLAIYNKYFNSEIYLAKCLEIYSEVTSL